MNNAERARLVVILVALVTGLAGLAGPAGAELIDRVLAVVGNRVVTLSDARAALEFGLVQPRPGADPVKDALEYLINRRLMLSEVDRYAGPPPDPQALARRVQEVTGRFPDRAALQAALDRTAMTDTRLRDLVSDTLRIEAYLDQRFSAQALPTPDEVERYYKDHPAEFTRNGRLAPFAQVRADAWAKVTAERRVALIADWLDRIRRRAAITLR